MGRSAQCRAIGELLGRAAGGHGGILALVGAAGTGKTALAAAAADLAAELSLTTIAARAVQGQPPRLVWATLLRDGGGPDQVVAQLLSEPSALDLDAAVRHLLASYRGLALIDDLDAAGPEAREFLAMLAARVATSSVAVVVTSSLPLGVGDELELSPLTEIDIAELTGESRAEVTRSLRAASRGVPRAVVALTGHLATLPADADPVVALALSVESDAGFLHVDSLVVRLLELALDRDPPAADRAMLLAKLSRELLGDTTTVDRRRALLDEAATLAAQLGDPALQAGVIDARLHALWAPDIADERLDAAARIVELARLADDAELELRGMFWSFIGLVEAGRIVEAENALVAYERIAPGDAATRVLILSRQAMIALLRGRWDLARSLAEQVADIGSRGRVPDTDRLVRSIYGPIHRDCGPASEAEAAVAVFLDFARRMPGHHFEASAALILASLGRLAEASAELDRVLPRLLAGSGPRWLGEAAQAAHAAVLVRDRRACAGLHHALLPYSGRFAIWGGANSCFGPVDRFLGMLATALGRPNDAIRFLEQAAAAQEQVGALPGLAWTLAALGDALDRHGADHDPARAASCRERARAVAGGLGMQAFLDTMQAPAGYWSLRRDGADWVLDAGDEHARLRDSRGLHYLARLLAKPGAEIAASALVVGQDAGPARSAGPVLDRQAAAAYRARLDELVAAADAADRAGDRDQAAAIEAERAAILAQLRSGLGLGGRAREFSSEDERARVSVTKALRAAVDRMADSAPLCAGHLRASIRTGRYCRYEPGPGGPTGWLA